MMIRKEFNANDWQFPFVAYYPENMEENMPLVVQLHGAGEVGNGGEELWKVDRNGFSHMLSEGKDYPCIFIMPQCPKESIWVVEVLNIHSFIQKVMETFPVDPKRVYLTGLSMGGQGTWYTAIRFPDTFAAIAPICGRGLPGRRASFLKMPIWAFHGIDDDIVPPTESLDMIRSIRTLGGNPSEVKLTMVDHVAHNVWEYAYNEQLLEWLLAQKRTV